MLGQNTVTEMKIALEGLISRLEITEERIPELDHITRELWKLKNKEKKRLKKNNIQELRGNYKRFKIHAMGVPERKENEEEREAIFKQQWLTMPPN